MRPGRFTTVLISAALLATGAPLQAAAPVQWTFAPKDVIHYRVTQDQSFQVEGATQGVRQVNDMDWVVQSVDAEGAARVRVHVVRVRLEQSLPTGRKYSYDTASDQTPQGLVALMAPVFDAMVENGFEFTLSTAGKASDFKAPEGLSNALKNVPGAAALGNESTLLGQVVQPCLLPTKGAPLAEEEEVQVERELSLPFAGRRIITDRFTYQGEKQVGEQDCAVFDYSCELREADAAQGGPFAMELGVAESSGEVLFDREQGQVVSAKLKQTLNQVLKVQEREVHGKLVQSTTVERLAERAEGKPPSGAEDAQPEDASAEGAGTPAAGSPE